MPAVASGRSSGCKPSIDLAMGSTAARSVMGREMRVMSDRGQFFSHEWAESVLVTVHPSALLRIPEHERREAEWKLFVRDLGMINEWLTKHPKS